jgi:hypothetical protein
MPGTSTRRESSSTGVSGSRCRPDDGEGRTNTVDDDPDDDIDHGAYAAQGA